MLGFMRPYNQSNVVSGFLAGTIEEIFMTISPKIKLSEDAYADVIDPNSITPVFADLVTELRVVDSILHISFANLIVDGEAPNESKKAQVCARLRISGNTVGFIRNILDDITNPQNPSGQTVN
jgi:hypothetical protein